MPGTIYPSAGENNIVNTAGIQTITGPKTLLAGTVSATPLTVQVMTGQTANAVEFRNNLSFPLATFDRFARLTLHGPGTEMARAEGAITRALIIPADSGERGLVIRGAASQSANMQEWQSSASSILAYVRSDGGINAPFYQISTTNGGASFLGSDNSTNNDMIALGNRAAKVAFAVRGAASQAQNLAEFQNSGGTVLSSVSQDGILTARSINVNNLFSGFQPVLYLTAHATQSANMTEWRNSAGTVISRVLSNGSFEMNGISSGVVAATLVNSSNLGTGAGARTYIAKIFTQTSNATGFYIDSIRASAGTDWSTADLALRRFTDATDQQSITFNGGSAQIGYNAAQHNFNSAVHATSYVTTSTRESKEDIVYLQAGAAEPRSLEGRKTSLVHNESLSNRFSKLRAVSYYPKMVVPPAEGDDALKVKPRVQRLHSFVAEEAAEIMPEIVSFDADGNPEGIDLNATSTMQTIIIQELLARVDSLENRLNAKGAV